MAESQTKWAFEPGQLTKAKLETIPHSTLECDRFDQQAGQTVTVHITKSRFRDAETGGSWTEWSNVDDLVAANASHHIVFRTLTCA